METALSSTNLPEASAHSGTKLDARTEACLGSICPDYQKTVSSPEMRRKAQESDIVIVNHHLFFADLGVQAEQHRWGARCRHPSGSRSSHL